MSDHMPEFLRQAPPHAAAIVLVVLLLAALPLVFTLPLTVSGMFAALLLLRALLLRWQVSDMPQWLLAACGIAVAALVWSQLGTVFGREGGIAFLLLVITLKAFECKTRRDWHVMLLAMLFLIGSSVLLNQSLIMALWLLLALPAVVVCFAVLAGLSWREAWRDSGLVLLLTLPLTAVLFVSVPRMSEPLWHVPQQKNQAQTGLSEIMQPGSIGHLVQSDEWVANIIFSDGMMPDTQNLYWRAVMMDQFDGRRWYASDDVAADNSGSAAGAPVAYQMIVRDQNGILPVLDYPIGAAAGAAMRSGRVLRAERSRDGLRRLHLQSAVADILPQHLSRAAYHRYTALPQGNPQTLKLVESLVKNATGERDYIRRVLDYFRRHGFAYTLQPPVLDGSHQVDEFLFRSRQGFCEHYAQAFAVMMRAAGLPARIVTGYLGAQYNEQAGFWQIRSKDAHAWAEVWLPSENVWLRVDPTAAVSQVRAAQGIERALPQHERAWVQHDGLLSKWRDAGQFYFQQWVVNYDQSRQNSLFAAFGLGGFNWKTLLLVLPVLFAMALLPLWRWWRSNTQGDDLQAGFMLLKQALLGENEDHAAVTASELRMLMQQNGVEDNEIERLLAQYETWRYAGHVASEREKKRWYKNAKRAAKRYLS